MGLQQEIDKTRAEIRTDGYPISIGEWVSIYEKHELDIHPEFQRFFRWSIRQKSRLIESLLLGIPIPEIFVARFTTPTAFASRFSYHSERRGLKQAVIR